MGAKTRGFANLITATGTLSGWSVDSGNLLPADAAKGIYLGVNSATAANLMDDFEEGTFDCSLVAGGATTPSQTQQGYYVKMGKCVMVHGQTTVNASSSGGVNLRFDLPFAVVGSYRGGIAVGLNQPLSISNHSGAYLSLVPELGSVACYVLSHAQGGNHTHLTFNDVGTGIFSFGGTYYTSA